MLLGKYEAQGIITCLKIESNPSKRKVEQHRALEGVLDE